MLRSIITASIIAGAILLAAAAMIYFSAYQTCVRAVVGSTELNGTPLTARQAKTICAVRGISN